MAARPQRKKPNFDLIRHKVGEAAFFLYHLKRQRELQKRPEKPPPREFSYYLSAFLSAAYTVGKLMERIKRNWWDRLDATDLALYNRIILGMRGDTVHAGQIETKRKEQEVRVRPDPTYYMQGNRIQSFFFQSMFGDVTTIAETHSVDLNGIEREVVDLCEEYLALLRREVGALEKG